MSSFLESPHRNRTVTDLEQEIDQLHLKLGLLRQQAAKALPDTIGQHDARRGIEACESRWRDISRELRRRRRT